MNKSYMIYIEVENVNRTDLKILLITDDIEKLNYLIDLVIKFLDAEEKEQEEILDKIAEESPYMYDVLEQYKDFIEDVFVAEFEDLSREEIKERVLKNKI